MGHAPGGVSARKRKGAFPFYAFEFKKLRKSTKKTKPRKQESTIFGILFKKEDAGVGTQTHSMSQITANFAGPRLKKRRISLKLGTAIEVLG